MMRSLSYPRGKPDVTTPEGPFRRLLLAAGCRDFGPEIGFLLLDSLAQSIAHKSGDLDRRADLTLSFFYRLGDRFGAVVDEGLLQQADFLVIGLQAGLDDLLDHVLRLALLAVFVCQHVLFALDDRRIQSSHVQRLRIGGRD